MKPHAQTIHIKLKKEGVGEWGGGAKRGGERERGGSRDESSGGRELIIGEKKSGE